MGGVPKSRNIRKSSPIEEIRPKTTTNAAAKSFVDSDIDKNEEPSLSRPSTTGSRRSRIANTFKTEDSNVNRVNMGGSNNNKTNDTVKFDFDDSFELPEPEDDAKINKTTSSGNNTSQPISTSLRNSTSNSNLVSTEIHRPPTTVGRRKVNMWGNDKDDVGVMSSNPSATPVTIQKNDAKPEEKSNQDDSLDMDFDVDALLPEGGSGSSQRKENSERDVVSDMKQSTNKILMPHVPRGPASSKGRSPSPSKTTVSNLDLSTSSEKLNMRKGLTVHDDKSAAGKSVNKAADDDDVDIGFMPSFLEAGREPRSKR